MSAEQMQSYIQKTCPGMYLARSLEVLQRKKANASVGVVGIIIARVFESL